MHHWKIQANLCNILQDWGCGFACCKLFDRLARVWGPHLFLYPLGRNSQIDISHLGLLKMSLRDNLPRLFKSLRFRSEASWHLSLSLEKISLSLAKNTPNEHKCSFTGSIINVVTSRKEEIWCSPPHPLPLQRCPRQPNNPWENKVSCESINITIISKLSNRRRHSDSCLR